MDDPTGSGPGDPFKASRTATVVVANVSQVVAVDRTVLAERVGHLSENDVGAILAGIDVMLGRL